jgi:hypothetical protein
MELELSRGYLSNSAAYGRFFFARLTGIFIQQAKQICAVTLAQMVQLDLKREQ